MLSNSRKNEHGSISLYISDVFSKIVEFQKSGNGLMR